MILKDIIHIIESVAPLSYQADWDNSGLQVGNPRADIEAVLLTIDVTESVVGEAIEKGCGLIISHHPLLFHGLKSICGVSPQERCVEAAIRHRIAIYSCHTPIDSCLHGVSGKIAELLGIDMYKILVPTMLSGDHNPHGLGVIGSLPQPIEYSAFLHRVKTALGASWVRYTDAPKDMVEKVAVCGGSGAEFIEEAVSQGADVYLTADIKYHEMQSAVGRIALVDIDHWSSECHVRDVFRNLLADNVKTYVSEADATPIRCLV